MTSLRLLAVLDVGSSTPARAKRLAPRPDGPLTHFASPLGETCRLRTGHEWTNGSRLTDFQRSSKILGDWRYRLRVRTGPSQGSNTGSNPVSAARPSSWIQSVFSIESGIPTLSAAFSVFMHRGRSPVKTSWMPTFRLRGSKQKQNRGARRSATGCKGLRQRKDHCSVTLVRLLYLGKEGQE